MNDKSVQPPSDGLRVALQSYLSSRAQRRPRVVQFGNYGQGNLGDEAILRSLLAIMSPVAQVTVISRAPVRVRQLHEGAEAETAFSHRGLRAIARADVVAIGGGGIFGNNMALLPRLLPVLALVLRLFGKRIVFVAIGAYTTTPRLIQWILRFVARHSDLITVRDEESAGVLGRARCLVVADPGRSIEPAAPPAIDAYLTELGVVGVPLFGVSLKPAAASEVDRRQLRYAAAAVRQWRAAEPSGVVLLLCLSERGNSGHGLARTDRTLADELISQVGDPASVRIVPAEVTPWLMKGVIGRCQAVVAHRLHAQMFAFEQRVPLLGMTWERKSDVFLADAGVAAVDLRRPAYYDVDAWVDTAIGRVAAVVR